MELEIFVDGACSGNPGAGGWGFVVVANKEAIFEQNGCGEGFTTNNIMELTAIREALTFAINTRDIFHWTGVCVYCDSAYCVNGLTQWIEGWKRNGWLTSAKQPVKNKELWQQIDALVQRFPNFITFQKVKGHANNEYNEIADRLAVAGRKMYEELSK